MLRNKQAVWIAAGAAGVVTSMVAIRLLLNVREVREWLAGISGDPNLRRSHSLADHYVDSSSADSFPASDAPSFTPTTSLGQPT
jgi:hypothetical protein